MVHPIGEKQNYLALLVFNKLTKLIFAWSKMLLVYVHAYSDCTV